ncbi:MAG: hypothetical protein HY681_01795 [Chloroflexi bacterium]|nr:hypothetical protein [Chloroflexota bacterium]
MPHGITVHHDHGGKRLEVQCPHQNGLIYVVPSQASWVCEEETLHVHALAGFFKELATLQNQQVKELMQRWGIYYRERPVEKADGA